MGFGNVRHQNRNNFAIINRYSISNRKVVTMVLAPASSYASQAIQKGVEDLRRYAGEIAATDRAAGDNGNRGMAESLLGTTLAASRVEASVKVLQTEDRVLGALLDVRA